jgi:GDPmannose 4,6-dehydratase
MWEMLQMEKPDNYVVATGESHSIREFLDISFGIIGLNWKDYVVVDPNYFRPTEVESLLGDPSKIKSLGWRNDYSFKDLVHEMVAYDYVLAAQENNENPVRQP